MPDRDRKDLGDTTLCRIARVGFNARVEPIRATYTRMRKRLGFFARWRERRRVDHLVLQINQGLTAMKIAPEDWHLRDGSCACNLRVAKMGLVAGLRTHLKETGSAAEWPHLMGARDTACYAIPRDFPKPLTLTLGGLDDPVPILSAPRLRQELASVNRRLHLDESFALGKMVDFMEATERDVASFEARFGTDDNFWHKFAYVLLVKLADVSARDGFPIIFA